MHSPYLGHLRETADGSCHASVMKQNLCRLLRSACLHDCQYRQAEATGAYPECHFCVLLMWLHFLGDHPYIWCTTVRIYQLSTLTNSLVWGSPMLTPIISTATEMFSKLHICTAGMSEEREDSTCTFAQLHTFLIHNCSIMIYIHIVTDLFIMRKPVNTGPCGRVC